MAQSIPHGILTSVGVSRTAGMPGAVMFSVGAARLPDDPVGLMYLTLTNLVVGSSIRIEGEDGTLREFRVASSSDEVFTLQVYPVGSSNNDLVVKVRKATTQPKYQAYSTRVSAVIGSQSVYIAQVPDYIAV